MLLVARGGQWDVAVWTIYRRGQHNQGARAPLRATVKNVGGMTGRFLLRATLGVFAPEDVAKGGPLYPPGGPMKFYWAAGRSPNPGNLATYHALSGAREVPFTLGAGQITDIDLLSAPLRACQRWDGQWSDLLDVHWELYVEVDGRWEYDFQQADRQAIKVLGATIPPPGFEAPVPAPVPGPAPAPPPSPGAPFKVSSVAYSETSADLTIGWNPVPGATYYKLWHKDEGFIATVTGTQYTVRNLYPNSPYTCAVAACNDAGCSALGPTAVLYTAAYAAPSPVPPSPVGLPTLSRGSTGPYVRFLQARLADLGFSPGAADGIFGSGTESAVKQFQQSRGLAPDGVVGSQTWAALVQVPPYFPTLSRGSTGPYVYGLQARLADLGFSPGAIDGIFGSGTESAVRQFQQSRGLTADGIVGRQTWAALLG